MSNALADYSVLVWNATSGEELLTLKGHTHEVNRVAFSPDGKRLASANGDLTVNCGVLGRGLRNCGWSARLSA